MNKNKLKIIISGVSSDVGQKTAKLLLEEGNTVIGISRNKPEQLTKFSNLFFWFYVDFLQTDTILKFINNKKINLDKIDIFINFIAKGHFSNFYETDDIKIQNLIKVNLTSLIILTKNLVNKIKKNGKIIFITSVAVNIPSPLSSIYAALKSAQEKLVNSWDIELSQNKIKCKIFRPGLINTNFLIKSGVPKNEISNHGQTSDEVAKNLIKFIKNNKSVKNSGSARIITFVNYLLPNLLKFLVKNKYIKRLNKLQKI